MVDPTENIWLQLAINSPYHLETPESRKYIPTDSAELAVGGILHNLSDRGFDDILSNIDPDIHKEILADCANIIRDAMSDKGSALIEKARRRHDQ